MTYDVLASEIYGKFTGELKSNEYQKSSISNQINWESLKIDIEVQIK